MNAACQFFGKNAVDHAMAFDAALSGKDVSLHHHLEMGLSPFAREGGETHFEVVMKADVFAGKSRVECHRMVNSILAEELASSVHALQLTLSS